MHPNVKALHFAFLRCIGKSLRHINDNYMISTYSTYFYLIIPAVPVLHSDKKEHTNGCKNTYFYNVRCYENNIKTNYYKL